MRAFHMNLLVYNANTQFPAGAAAATEKHQALRAEMARVGLAIDIAGFTEVGVANAATPANVTRAFNDFGAALGIPLGAAGAQRHIAVIRCGRTALQDNNEVVALVINGNAVINRYELIYFTQAGAGNTATLAVPPNGAAARYTTSLALPTNALADYRFVVKVNFTLGGNIYDIGFIHNRAPGQDHVMVVMPWIRTLLEQARLGLCGGDFNTAPPLGVVNASGILLPPTGHHQNAYYSPGLTTLTNAYDYWVGGNAVLPGPVAAGGPAGAPAAVAGRTPTSPLPAAPVPPVVPAPVVTGSDHRGVWITLA